MKATIKNHLRKLRTHYPNSELRYQFERFVMDRKL